MKKIFTLSITLLLAISLYAFPQQNLLTISSNAKYPVTVVIDNRTYNQGNSIDHDVVVNNLRPGYHRITIYRKKSNWQGNKRAGTYNQQLLYNGTVSVKPGYHVDITINRFGKAFIDERQINSTYYNDDEQADWNGNDPYKQPMNAAEFDQFKKTINNGRFENTRLALAKQTMSRNYFTSAQVKEIVGLFSFEDNKLDIAKYAYKYSTDKNNYFLVSDALEYSSSKEELATFLQTAN